MKNNKALSILMLLFAAVAVSALAACSTDLSSVESRIDLIENRMDSEYATIEADQKAIKAIQDLQAAMEAENASIKELIERITLDEKTIAELQKQVEDLSARIAPEPTATPEAEAQDAEPQPAPQLPPPTMTKLYDDVYHYFGFFTSSLVVIADDGVLITDPSNFPRGQSLKEEIAKLTSAPVTTIVLTHEHYDHVGGTGLFPDAQVVCHRNCEATFDLDTLGDVPAEVHQTFDDMMEITVGDKTVQLHYLGPGDGDATTIIYMPDEQIIATADMYEPRALTHKNWVHDKNFVGTRSILNTISKWPIKYAINGHSPGTDPVDLMENVEYYNDLYDAVKVAVDDAIMQAGGAAFGAYGLYDTLPQTLELEKYKEWLNYDNSFPSHVERMLLSIYHGD